MDFMALETILSSCNGLRASLLFRHVCLDVGRCPLFLNFFRFFFDCRRLFWYFATCQFDDRHFDLSLSLSLFLERKNTRILEVSKKRELLVVI